MPSVSIDLHGAEVLHLPSQATPITVGPSSIVGLVGAAPNAQAAVAARRVIGTGNAAFTITADTAGVAGNDISVAVVAESGSLAVAYDADSQRVTITLAGGGSTANEIIAAANGAGAVSAVVTAVRAAGSDGSGSLTAAIAAAPLAGGADEPFPLDTPVLLTGARAATRLGASGSLPEAIADVWRTSGRYGATIVAVRVADDTAAAIIGSRTGVAASRTIGAGDAALTITADAAGVAGNDITVEIVAEVSRARRAISWDAAASKLTIRPVTNSGSVVQSSEYASSIIASINSSAAPVTATSGGTGADVVAAAAATRLTGGRDPLSGLYALLAARSRTGQQPRLIAAPGRQDNAVTSALETVAEGLHGVAVVTLDAASAAAAIALDVSAEHVYACWPKLVIYDSALGRTRDRPMDGLVIGTIARNDREESYAASPSNRRLYDVLRTAVDVDWQIDSRTATANLLSRAYVTTAVRRDGGSLYLWGNRLRDGELISHRRTRFLIGDALLSYVVDYIDRNVDVPFVEFILSKMNGFLRTQTLAKKLTGGRAWFDAQYNTVDTLSADHITFSFELGLYNIAEQITFRSSVSTDYNERIIEQLTRG